MSGRAGSLTLISAGILIIGIATLFATVALSGQTEDGEPAPAPEIWIEALEMLRAVDDAAAAGDAAKAVALLETVVLDWPESLTHCVEAYSEELEGGEVSSTDSRGLALFADAVREIEDGPLRTDLEDRILALDPPRHLACASVLMGRGVRLFQEDDLESALVLFRLAIKEHPGTPLQGTFAFNIGVALRDLHRYEEAIQVFEGLLEMDVNNHELVGESVMDLGYRNYHYRSALNISWCYEKLGRFREAYRWVELAETQYPYKGFCGTCAGEERIFLAKDADRLARAAGGLLSVSHAARAVQRNWIGWTGWLLWGLGVFAATRRFSAARPWLVYTSVPAAVVIATGVAFQNAGLFGGASVWLEGVWFLRWVVPGFLLGIALILHVAEMGGARVFSICALLFALAGHLIWVYHYGRYYQIIYLPLRDMQSAFFSFYALPAALLMSAVLAAWGAFKMRRRKVVFEAATS